MNCSGQRIKAVRILRGLTLKEVADQIGVQEATIQRYESGQIKSIPQDRLLALANALDTSSEYLLGIGPESNCDRGADQFVEWILSPSETSGNNIRTRREELNLDVSALAEIVGISRQTIYRYESGKVENASPRIISKLAKALHTNIAYILGKTSDPDDISPSAISIQNLFAAWAREDRELTDSESDIKARMPNAVEKAKELLVGTVMEICKETKPLDHAHQLRELELMPARIGLVTDFVERNADFLKRNMPGMMPQKFSDAEGEDQ